MVGSTYALEGVGPVTQGHNLFGVLRVPLNSRQADDPTFNCFLGLIHDPDRRRQEENAVWDQVQAKDACLRRLGERGFPKDMLTLAEASDRFYELGVYYRNPLQVRYAPQRPLSPPLFEIRHRRTAA